MASERARRTVEILRATPGRRRARRVPRQRLPVAIERDYKRLLIGHVNAIRDALRPAIDRAPLLIESARAERRDIGEGDEARRLIEQVRRRIESITPVAAVEAVARRVLDHNRRQLGAQVRAAFGTDLFVPETGIPQMIDEFVPENVSLIRGLSREVADGVEQTITRAISDGTTKRALGRQLAERFRLGRNRARLIADDQIGKLYGRVNARRQQNIGVDGFIWRDVSDERVRPRHRELDGRRFSYPDGAPGEGLPGQPVRCRCYADPDFGSILGGLE